MLISRPVNLTLVGFNCDITTMNIGIYDHECWYIGNEYWYEKFEFHYKNWKEMVPARWRVKSCITSHLHHIATSDIVISTDSEPGLSQERKTKAFVSSYLNVTFNCAYLI